MRLRILIAALFFLLPTIVSASIVKPPNNLGLVGYWNFDEGTSTKANDYSGQRSTGTLSGSTLPAWVAGKHGKALSFDGSSGYVSLGNPGALNLSTSYTISTWIKPNTFSNYQNVIYKNGSGGASGQYGFIIFADKHWEAEDLQSGTPSGVSGGTLTAGVWQHLVATFQGTTLKTYLNGVLQNTSNVASNSSAGTGPTIGTDLTNGRYFNGTIDDVRIYNRALSASEVTTLYSQGEGKTNTSGANLNNGTTLANGLVGYWTFDGGQTIWGTGKTYDSSGQNNTGLLLALSTTTSPIPGKLGQALSFTNGTSGGTQCVKSTNSVDYSSGWTVAGWFNWQALSAKGNERPFGSSGLGPAFWRSSSTFGIVHGGSVDWNTGWTIPSKKWTHVVVTRSGSTATLYVNGNQQAQNTSFSNPYSSGLVSIGCDTGITAEYLKGYVDDVRIYNRAISATEVKQLYNMASSTVNSSSQALQNGTSLSSGLVGLWTFDGKDFTDKIYDRSGQGNNGYLNSGTATSSVKTGGKLGQGVKFDGSSQYVSFSTIPVTGAASFSVSAWMKTAVTGTEQALVFFGATNTNQSFYLRTTAGNKIHADFYGGGGAADGTTNITDNKWHHVVATYNGSTLTVYTDGVSQATGSSITGSLTSGENDIGRDGESGNRRWFNGQLDDVRVYNRALSAAEVKSLYNMGK